MMPATKTSKTKAAPSITAHIREQHRAARAEALARWRDWVRDAEGGEKIPDPPSLYATAKMLGIQRPVATLEDDVRVLREIAAAERGKALCAATEAERLAPWGGDRGRLQKAIEAAEAEVRRLRGILDSDSAGAYWHGVESQLRGRNQRLFAPADEYLSRFETELDAW